MDKRLLEAASTGDVTFLHLVSEESGMLFSTTPRGNNCLHIAAMLGHDKFAKELCNYKRAYSRLLSCANINGETPLISALMAANASLASALIGMHLEANGGEDLEAGKPLNEILLMVDRFGDNALHHALRNGFENIGLRILDIEPRLSEQVNKGLESVLHMACRKGYIEVAKKLIRIPSCVHFGPQNYTALDAAIRAENIGMVKELLKERPNLAYVRNGYGYTAVNTAANCGQLEIVKILLEHDPHQAYIQQSLDNGGSTTPFLMAIRHDFLSIAQEIMRHCPDAAYDIEEPTGSNALHIAIEWGNMEIVDYVLKDPKLHRLINQPNNKGELPLHRAASLCKPEVIRSLISHKPHDYSAVDVENSHAGDIIYSQTDICKTLKWTEAYMLVSNAIPSVISRFASSYTKRLLNYKAEQEIRSLTQTYTSNTSLVAALIATITFAAAFTLPGGYSSDSSEEGLPIFAKKIAFQVFLISDTIAMCSSLAVAFLCIFATWEDLDFLLNYRRSTRVLMWCAYGATAVAFATGLFTVIAPKSLWLAVVILVLTSLLPFLSKLIGELPMLKLRLRLGRHYRPDLTATIKDAI